MELRPDQYSIIHNMIDTEKFRYVKKTPELRKKVLTIKPFANKKYANDLTTKGILELSKRPCFQDMEFAIYGRGELFDERVKNGMISLHDARHDVSVPCFIAASPTLGPQYLGFGTAKEE